MSSSPHKLGNCIRLTISEVADTNCAVDAITGKGTNQQHSKRFHFRVVGNAAQRAEAHRGKNRLRSAAFRFAHHVVPTSMGQYIKYFRDWREAPYAATSHKKALHRNLSDYARTLQKPRSLWHGNVPLSWRTKARHCPARGRSPPVSAWPICATYAHKIPRRYAQTS